MSEGRRTAPNAVEGSAVAFRSVGRGFIPGTNAYQINTGFSPCGYFVSATACIDATIELISDCVASSAGSIADEFRLAGVYFNPAKKADRVTSWQRMKRMLADAGKPDVPGLYFSRACAYWWATVPTLARDPKRVEDVDSSGPDHAADACRYGLLAQTWARDIQVKWPYR